MQNSNLELLSKEDNATTKLLPGFTKRKPKLPKATYHPQWQLMRVIAGHTGWVKSVAVEHGNEWFATGSTDATIKVWDLASGTLKITLTGHISTVRGLCISDRHPYLFSVGEDKMVKCWDLEQNKVVRHYHGHLAGIYAISMHPLLDIFATGSRDGTAKLWDMRSKQCIHTLSSHKGPVNSVQMQGAEPQLITGSQDCTVRLWDIVAGKSLECLTHHKKSIRSLLIHPSEFTFASAAADNIKKWSFPHGDFLHNFSSTITSVSPAQCVPRTIVNSLCVNPDGVLFAGSDNGAMSFYDWPSGECFQTMQTIKQPGSLESEAGIFCSTFDRTGLRLITGEADKSIKVWKEMEEDEI